MKIISPEMKTIICEIKLKQLSCGDDYNKIEMNLNQEIMQVKVTLLFCVVQYQMSVSHIIVKAFGLLAYRITVPSSSSSSSGLHPR